MGLERKPTFQYSNLISQNLVQLNNYQRELFVQIAEVNLSKAIGFVEHAGQQGYETNLFIS